MQKPANLPVPNKRKDYESHKDYTARWYRDKRIDDPVYMMLKKAKERAKEKGLEFNLTREDIQIPLQCPVLGIFLVRQIGKASFNSPVLDRLDNSKGYIKGNVNVISQRANRIKSDASWDEINAILKYMERLGPTCS